RDTGHHQELLEELRRLRQRVEGALLEAARDEEVAGALGGRAGQDRRLDLDEAVAVELLPHRRDQLGAELQRFLARFAAQVEVAVAQTRLLPRLAAAAPLDLKRRRRRVGEQLRLGAPDLARGPRALA